MRLTPQYQKTTSYEHGTENGVIQITIDGETAIITKLAAGYPIASVVMTLAQAREVERLLQDGVKAVRAQ